MPVARNLRVASAGGSGGITMPSATATYMAWNQDTSGTGYVGAYKMDAAGTAAAATYSAYGVGGWGTTTGHTTWSRGATWLAATRANGYVYTYPFTGSGFGSGAGVALASTLPPARGASMAIAPNNERIVAFNRDGYGIVYGVNPATGAFLTIGSSFGWSEPQQYVYQVAWAPTTDVFVATQYTSPYAYMWLTSGTTVTGRAITNWGAGSLLVPAGAAWSADGNVCFLSSNNNIYAVTRSGSNFTANTTPAVTGVNVGGNQVKGLAMSPDGKLLAALTGGSSSNLLVYAVNGTALSQVLSSSSGAGNDSGVAWSPDGQKLYTLRYYSAFTQMWAAMWTRTGTTAMSATRADIAFTGSGSHVYNVDNALSIAS